MTRATYTKAWVLMVLGLALSVSRIAHSEEPQSPAQLRQSLTRIRQSLHTPFTFTIFPKQSYSLEHNVAVALPGTIRGHGRLMLETDAYAFWISPSAYHSSEEAIDAFIKSLEGNYPLDYYRRTHTQTIARLYPTWPDAPKVFWNMMFEDQRIGDASYGKRAGGWPAHAVYWVTFWRDNRVLRVECSRLKGNYSDPAKPIFPDPREIAFKLDRYYSSDPTAELPAEEKARRKTLSVQIEAPDGIVAGRKYNLHFPLLSGESAPTELRLRVTGGEIWDVIHDVAQDKRLENDVPQSEPQHGRAAAGSNLDDPWRNYFGAQPKWVPPDERQYFVNFYRPGQRTLSCYHINAKGECTAWGEVTVDVKKAP